MSIEKHTFTYQGLKLCYYVIGQGEPILFLHGGVKASTYQISLELLAKKYRVIAPDLPFFGCSSSPPVPWTIHEYSLFISQFIDSLGYPKIILAGHSLGGLIGLYLAKHNPRISKLIIAEPGGFLSHYSFLKLFYKSLIEKSWTDFFLYRKFKIWLKITLDFLIDLPKHLWHLEQAMILIKESIYTNNGLFQDINCPTLIIWAKKDEFFSLAYAQQLKQKIKNSKLVITQKNHDWCIFAPEEFARLLSDFIKKN